MTKKTRPFWAGNQPKVQPQVKKANPQIVVTLDLAMNQVKTECNFKDWDNAIGMLIDALRGAHVQKMKEKDQKIVLAKPQIILPT